MLDKIIEIARDAGRVVNRHYEAARAVEVVTKDDGSPLTIADRESNALIVERLAALTPDIPIIAEETGIPPHEVRKDWPRFWLVDPLDGTKEFIKRNGEFTINIALVDRGIPVVGVVYACALDLLYAAERGGGAWKHQGGGDPVRLHSKVAAPGEPVVVVTSRSHASGNLAAMLPGVDIREERSVGSALKFGLVAEGEAEVYARESPTMEWDVAAGDCVFRESGPEGPRTSPLRYNKPDLLNEPFVIGLAY